jgi:hypothetical protein
MSPTFSVERQKAGGSQSLNLARHLAEAGCHVLLL